MKLMSQMSKFVSSGAARSQELPRLGKMRLQNYQRDQVFRKVYSV